MPQLKLIYFNSKGRAEISRLILAQAGVEYEDKRIEKPDWPALKPTIPFGQLPALEVDGVIVGQSIAIARYLAREYNLAGKNNVEQALADMYVDCTTDLLNKFIPVIYMEDGEKKAEAMKAFSTDTLPPFMTNFEGVLKKNGGKYLVGSGLTYADIVIAYMIEQLSARTGDSWKKAFPTLAKFSEDVMNLPNIKAWVAKRPVTEG